MSPKAAELPAQQRLDVWLVYARFAKTRGLAQALVARGKVRVNRHRIDKPSHSLKPGDTLTLALGPKVRIIEVAGLGTRRGPAAEAATLFRELTPPPERTTSSRPLDPARANPAPFAEAQGIRSPGSGRPTKRERRATERLKDQM